MTRVSQVKPLCWQISLCDRIIHTPATMNMIVYYLSTINSTESLEYFENLNQHRAFLIVESMIATRPPYPQAPGNILMYLEYIKGNIIVFDVSNTGLFMNFLLCYRSMYFVINHCVLAVQKCNFITILRLNRS